MHRGMTGWLNSNRQDMMKWLAVAAASMAAALLTAAWPRLIAPAAQRPAGDDIIRFHVIANSDSPADQALKVRVRNVLLADMAPRLTDARTREAAVLALRGNLGRMEELAAAELRRAGAAYPVRVEMGRFPFPVRESDGLVFPAGTYEAVRVVIGSGAGRNYWCVLYPAMCFIELPSVRRADAGVVPRAVQAFRLNDGTLLLADEGGTGQPPVQVRSALVDWLNSARHRLAALRTGPGLAAGH